jgi:hypothetical protein
MCGNAVMFVIAKKSRTIQISQDGTSLEYTHKVVSKRKDVINRKYLAAVVTSGTTLKEFWRYLYIYFLSRAGGTHVCV